MISLATSIPSPRQPQPRPLPQDQPLGDERREVGPEAVPHVDAVALPDRVEVDPVGEPQAREQRVLEPLVAG